MTNDEIKSAFDSFKAQVDALDASALVAVRDNQLVGGSADHLARVIERLKSDVAATAREAHLLP